MQKHYSPAVVGEGVVPAELLSFTAEGHVQRAVDGLVVRGVLAAVAFCHQSQAYFRNRVTIFALRWKARDDVPGDALGSDSVEGVPDQAGLSSHDHLSGEIFSRERVVAVVDRGVVVASIPVVYVQAEVAAGADASDVVDRVGVAGSAGGVATSAAAGSSGSAFAASRGGCASSAAARAGHASLAGGGAFSTTTASSTRGVLAASGSGVFSPISALPTCSAEEVGYVVDEAA